LYLLCIAIGFLFVPETKGKTFEEMSGAFRNKVGVDEVETRDAIMADLLRGNGNTNGEITEGIATDAEKPIVRVKNAEKKA
jgi:hypothetical protein